MGWSKIILKMFELCVCVCVCGAMVNGKMESAVFAKPKNSGKN